MKIRLFVFIFICALAFFPFSSYFENQEMLSILLNYLHFPVVCLITLDFLKSPLAINEKLKIGLLLIVIMAVELVQVCIGRDASLMDIVWGSLGLVSAKVYLSFPDYSYRMVVFFPYVVSLLVQIGFIGLPHLTYPVLTRADNYIDHLLFENVNEITEKKPIIISTKTDFGRVIQGNKLDYPWSGLSYKYILPIEIKNASKLEFDYYSETKIEELEVAITSESGKKVKTLMIKSNEWRHHSIEISDLFEEEIVRVSRVSIYYETLKGPNKYQIDNLLFKN
jgi:hypothetical protein